MDVLRSPQELKLLGTLVQSTYFINTALSEAKTLLKGGKKKIKIYLIDSCAHERARSKKSVSKFVNMH